MTWAVPHRGMPPLEPADPPISFFEFWPMYVFYTPVWPYILWLMLRHGSITAPLSANPSFEAGGLVGESKSLILALARQAAPGFVADYTTWDRPEHTPDIPQEAEAVLATIAAAGLALPLVAKPDRGCRGAGVRVIRERAALERYLAAFPPGQRIVLQRLVDHEAEAGIFYTRDSGSRAGAVRSITLKYFPYVIGDGRSTLQALILADPRAGQVPHLYLGRNAHRLDWVPMDGEPVRLAFAGSHSKGAIFRDGSHLITPAMSAAFDTVARAIPDFHFGRFDIRFDDYRNLQQGQGFTILEVNGAGAESTEIWDARMTLGRAYRILMRQWRWAFEIGAGNRKRGMPPVRFFDFWSLYRAEVRLATSYPSTD